jgi:hypothetical protein
MRRCLQSSQGPERRPYRVQVITIIMLGLAGLVATVHTAADGDVDPAEEKQCARSRRLTPASVLIPRPRNLRERAQYRFKAGTKAAKRAAETEKHLHEAGNAPEMPAIPKGEPASHHPENAE